MTPRRRGAWMRRLVRSSRGSVAVLVACMMPVLIGMAAFAVDYGTVQLDARRLQGVADAAALAAAGAPADAAGAAQALVAASWPRAAVTRTIAGRFRADAAVAPAQRFTPGAGDAVQIAVETRSPTFFAAIFGQGPVRIVRRATAQRRELASFAIGSRLVGVDGGLLGAVLGGLVGRPVTLGVLDHQGLVTSNVDLFGVVDRVRVKATLSVRSYDELLAADVQMSDLLAALAEQLAAGGDAHAAAAVRQVAAATPARTLRLAALVDAGPLGAQASGGAGLVRVPALALLVAALETGGARRIALDLGAGVPGVASLRVWLAIGERAQQAPWLAIDDAGRTIVRTAQARLYVRARLAPTALPGLASLAAIELPLFAQLAGAEGRLRAIDCSAASRAVTLEARVNPAEASLGTVDEAKLDDFATPLAPATAKLVDTPLVDVTGSSRLSLGAAEPWQALRFTQPMIDAGSPQTIRGAWPVSGVAASLAAHATLGVQVIGLPVPLDPLLRGVGDALSGVAGPVDRLLASVTGLLGIGVGEADLSVTGVRCGGAVLVG